jgi:NAD-dependent dihydropyrimidine dehydrogenase PreA subunit
MNDMKHTTAEYSELLNGRLPTSQLEFELCDRLLEAQSKLKNNVVLADVSDCPECGFGLSHDQKECHECGFIK